MLISDTFSPMAPSKAKALRWPAKTHLQEIFLKRVREEMVLQGLNPNSLSKRVGAPPQRTIQDVMDGRDPKLETVHAIASALGKAAHELMKETSNIGAPAHNIRAFPTYAPVLQQPHAPYRRKKVRDKAKTSA